jgi:hypothetical protein
MEMAKATFAEFCNKQKATVLKITTGDASIEVEDDYKERFRLGYGMLEQYLIYSQNNDTWFEPVAVELKWSFPLTVPDDVYLPPGLYRDYLSHHMFLTGQAATDEADVVVEGKIDMIGRDLRPEWEGWYWVFDHKTAKQDSNKDWLALDDQISAYCLAAWKTGLPIAGFVYSEIFKKVFHPPTPLKNGGFSKNKQQDTTFAMYVQTLSATYGKVPEEYMEFLEWLQENEKSPVKRTEIRRNEQELRLLERRILDEAIDMLDHPRIYPSPGKMNCNGCWFYAPCLTTQEGGDVKTILETNYRQRDNNAGSTESGGPDETGSNEVDRGAEGSASPGRP